MQRISKNKSSLKRLRLPLGYRFVQVVSQSAGIRLVGLCIAGLTLSGCTSLGESHFRLPSPALSKSVATANSPHASAAAERMVSTSTSSVAASDTSQAEVVTASAIGGPLRTLVRCGQCGTDCGGSCTAYDASCAHCGPTYPQQTLPQNRQEYIFDGGDQQPSVIIKEDWSTEGVDPTDTVIYYETLGGKVCVKASNRVPVYAPRFGSVRKVTGLELAARAVGTERMLAPVALGQFEETDPTGTFSQPLAALGQEQVGMLDAFQENNQGVPVAQVIPPLDVSESLAILQDINFFATGQIDDLEVPVLGRVLQNARSWYTPESVEVVLDGQQAALVMDAARAQDIHVYELPDKCAMRICKAASHTIANPGDTIRFTIRFDNVGVKPLGNAVIMDSLSPRLEYIEGSQTCSVDATFSAEPNEVGSSVLRWEIGSPVEKNEGGVVSFDCLVR